MQLVLRGSQRSSASRAASRGLGAAILLAALVGAPSTASAQELVPAAHTPAPVGLNLLTLSAGYSTGDVTFDPSLPVEDVDARIKAWSLSYTRTFGAFGRSANITVIAPYMVGDLEGLYVGEQTAVRRSGLGDAVLRVGVNLMGGPAMDAAAFRSYRPSTLVGASLIVRAPTGQYYPSKLINLGTNRWSFKPEVGVVHMVGRWGLEASLGGWLYTDNTAFNGTSTRAQNPIVSTEAHARYTVSPTLWAAIDANFWVGGTTTVDGVRKDDHQRNSRIGTTVVWRVAPAHGIRFAASRGAFTRIGGDFTSVGVSYNYGWM